MKKANKTVIGAFVVGALALLLVGIIAFGSGKLFSKSDKYILYFDRSVKGLSVGAPVIFKGVKLGTVSEINLVYESKTQDVLIEAVIDVNLSLVKGLPQKIWQPYYRDIIKEGLRAKLDTQSFVTGQLLVAFAFYPETEAKFHNLDKRYPELPTLPTPPDIFQVMDDMPIKEISGNLNQIVATINKVATSQSFAELDRIIKELSTTARAGRLLMEYLELHPEAFLKGKQNVKSRGD